jgi:hypothetical protein
MAYLRFEPQRLRTRVALVAGHKINGRAVQERVANLGSYIVAEAGEASERLRFWRQLAGRFAQIEAKHPGRFTSTDRARFETAINARIRRPTRAELRSERPSRPLARETKHSKGVRVVSA